MPPAPSERMRRLKPYPFAALERRIAELQTQGRDIIRLDIGSPDMAPPSFILDALERSARDPRAHGYAGYRGIPALRQAVARFYARRFGVELDPREPPSPAFRARSHTSVPRFPGNRICALQLPIREAERIPLPFPGPPRAPEALAGKPATESF